MYVLFTRIKLFETLLTTYTTYTKGAEMAGPIEISWQDLMRQSSSTSDTYFLEAMRSVIAEMASLREGGGVSIQPPSAEKLIEMGVRLAEVSAMDFQTSAIVVASQNIADAIRSLKGTDE